MSLPSDVSMDIAVRYRLPCGHVRTIYNRHPVHAPPLSPAAERAQTLKRLDFSLNGIKSGSKTRFFFECDECLSLGASIEKASRERRHLAPPPQQPPDGQPKKG